MLLGVSSLWDFLWVFQLVCCPGVSLLLGVTLGLILLIWFGFDVFLLASFSFIQMLSRYRCLLLRCRAR